MVDMTVKIEGLDEAVAAMQAAFPTDAKQQRRLLNSAMSGAARPTIIKTAKELALIGDGSGALSQAIKPRAVSLSRSRAEGVPARVQITPVRGDRKAIAMYIDHYYNRKGLAAPAHIVTSGIRHGHLIEYGHVAKGGGFVAARPFLWPALKSQASAYISRFAKTLEKKVAAAVRRRRRK